MTHRNSFLRLTLCAFVLVSPLPVEALNKVDLRLLGPANPELEEILQAQSVLKNLETQEDVTPAEVIAAARAEYARLIELLYGLGYYSVAMTIKVDGREAAQIEPFYEPAQVKRVDVVIDPGRPFRFGTFKIAPLAPGTSKIDAVRRDEPALATAVRDAAQAAVSDWRDIGHAKAEVTDQDVVARHEAARLDVELALAPGPRVTFGDVSVSGETAVREARVRQIAGIPRGEVFSPAAVEKAGQRLRKTGTFASVQVIEGETVDPDGTMDVDLTVIDRKPRRIGGGIELTSFDGLTLSGYWMHRNLFGGAERFRVDGEIAQLGGTGGGTDYSLSFRIEKPAVYGPDTLFFGEAGVFYLDEPDYIEEKVELTLGVSREINERLTGDLGIGYAFSRVTDTYTKPETTRELRMFSLPLGLTFDNRDDALDPKSGYFLRAAMTPFYETIGGQNGTHATLDARAYLGLGKDDKSVLAGRLQLGSLAGPSAVNAPPDFLFYSGGGGTVRGHPYKSLGADYGGVTLGGRSFAALSTELRFPVNDKFGLVAFADAGYVGDTFNDGDWHAGGGLGLRYKTPVGPIRFDVAGPLAGTTGDGMHFYIGIGQSF